MQLFVIWAFGKLQSLRQAYDNPSKAKAQLDWKSDVIGLNQARRVQNSVQWFRYRYLPEYIEKVLMLRLNEKTNTRANFLGGDNNR